MPLTTAGLPYPNPSDPVAEGAQAIRNLAEAAAPLATYGTTFPASPKLGAEHVLVDNAANPAYQWRFRYNPSSSSAYKWEFIGGAPLWQETPGTDTQILASPGNIPNGPFIQLPARAGDWLLEATAIVACTVADGQAWFNVGDGAVPGNTLLTSVFGQSPSAGRWSTVQLKGRANNVASGIALGCKGWGPGTTSYQVRRIFALPIRL